MTTTTPEKSLTIPPLLRQGYYENNNAETITNLIAEIKKVNQNTHNFPPDREPPL